MTAATAPVSVPSPVSATAPVPAPASASASASASATSPVTATLTTAHCEPCAGVQQHWRRAPGHAELVQGSNRKEERNGRQVTVTRYQCDRCGQVWDYENDKTNLHAGWSMVRPRGPRA